MEKNNPKETFPSHPGCLGDVHIPTEKEREILSEMRRIKTRVRYLKEQLRNLHGQESALQAGTAGEELARLKREWDALEEERKAAARERMILLGHE